MEAISDNNMSREESQESDLEIIDIDSIDITKDDETWLMSSPNRNHSDPSSSVEDWMSQDLRAPAAANKKSLVSKLNSITNGTGSPTRYSSTSSSSYSFSSPGVSSYMTRQNLSSTPLSKNQFVGVKSFDSRTFKKSSGGRSLLNQTFGLDDDSSDQILSSSPLLLNQSSFYKLSSPQLLNSTFDKDSSPGLGLQLNETYDHKTYFRITSPKVLNSTFNRDQAYSTYRKDNPMNSTFQKDDVVDAPYRRDEPDKGLNSTFEVRGAANTTFDIKKNFRKLSEDRLSSASSNVDHFSSHDLVDDDRLSTTSESSTSHRLNDVGDVQQIARLQEESLRQPIITANHRSATMSPSSEHSANSPSTEGYMTGNNMGYQSEEGGLEKVSTGGGHQYSSQDSLPDSPYSSQSLDVPPMAEQDRLRRSMPNLNKIRPANRGGAVSGGCGGAVPVSRGSGTGLVTQRPTYGALSRQHNSDPRLLQAGATRLRYYAPPSRGTTAAMSSNERLAVRATGLPQPRQYMPPPRQPGIAKTMPPPKTTCIPRPGSRLPGPRSGIPKPGGGSSSQHGSRSSSASSRKTSAEYYY